jgi:hypothetical protein
VPPPSALVVDTDGRSVGEVADEIAGRVTAFRAA